MRRDRTGEPIDDDQDDADPTPEPTPTRQESLDRIRDVLGHKTTDEDEQ